MSRSRKTLGALFVNENEPLRVWRWVNAGGRPP